MRPAWGQFGRPLCKSRVGCRAHGVYPGCPTSLLQLGRNGRQLCLSSHAGDWPRSGSEFPLPPDPATEAGALACMLHQVPACDCQELSGAPVHLSPVPTGCPSPSSRAVCHGPVMGTATASQWSTTASRRPLTSRPVSSTSLFSRRPTLQLVGELWRSGCWADGKMKAAVWMFPNLPPCRVPWPYYLFLYH